jgi:hypothetical protein
MISPYARRAGLLAILILGAVLLCTCDEDEAEKARRAQAQRQAQLQAQLQAEQAQQIQNEQSARAETATRNGWIVGLGSGACVVCLVVLLLGIHIGSRTVNRYKKEHADG